MIVLLNGKYYEKLVKKPKMYNVDVTKVVK